MNGKITAVIILTALSAVSFSALIHFSRKEKPEPLKIPASTQSERISYFASHGWEVEEISCMNIVIPAVFSEEYAEYVDIQDGQGLPLRENSGKNAVLYTYDVRNFRPDNQKLFAELIVCDGSISASLVYSEDGKSIISPVS